MGSGGGGDGSRPFLRVSVSFCGRAWCPLGSARVFLRMGTAMADGGLLYDLRIMTLGMLIFYDLLSNG